MITDLTFSNKAIKDFFEEEKGAYIPVGELVYIHNHPLMTPNFLTQLEAYIDKTGAVIKIRNITGHPIEEFTRLAILMGQKLPEVNYTNGEDLLRIMRDVYKLCKSILGSPISS